MIQETIAPVAGYVLDVACGPGTFARRVADGSRKVYGIDISTGMLKRGVILARREHVTNIRFARAQVEALPFGNETFDATICSGSLHLFADTALTLREIGRTLKSGAPLAIVTVTPGPAGFLRFRRVINYMGRRGLQVFEVPALERKLGEAGFENCCSTISGSLLTVRTQKCYPGEIQVLSRIKNMPHRSLTNQSRWRARRCCAGPNDAEVSAMAIISVRAQLQNMPHGFGKDWRI